MLLSLLYNPDISYCNNNIQALPQCLNLKHTFWHIPVYILKKIVVIVLLNLPFSLLLKKGSMTCSAINIHNKIYFIFSEVVKSKLMELKYCSSLHFNNKVFKRI